MQAFLRLVTSLSPLLPFKSKLPISTRIYNNSLAKVRRSIIPGKWKMQILANAT
jgi:hypothetical protein